MDYLIEQLEILIETNGGVVTTKDLDNIGIDRIKLYGLLTQGILKREAHGYYVLPKMQPDPYGLIQRRSDKIIFSYKTALYLQGFLDKQSDKIDITVPQGDNVTRVKKSFSEVQFHYCKKELWKLGITQAKTPNGYDVKVYDPERCICDFIKNRKYIDSTVYGKVIRDYFSEKCNVEKIVSYGRQLRVEDRIRTYMEILL